MTCCEQRSDDPQDPDEGLEDDPDEAYLDDGRRGVRGGFEGDGA